MRSHGLSRPVAICHNVFISQLHIHCINHLLRSHSLKVVMKINTFVLHLLPILSLVFVHQASGYATPISSTYPSVYDPEMPPVPTLVKESEETDSSATDSSATDSSASESLASVDSYPMNDTTDRTNMPPTTIVSLMTPRRKITVVRTRMVRSTRVYGRCSGLQCRIIRRRRTVLLRFKSNYV